MTEDGFLRLGFDAVLEDLASGACGSQHLVFDRFRFGLS